jgi:hypothetical protein
MRAVPALLVAIYLGATTGAAQAKPAGEIGTSLGVTILSASGQSVTRIGVPGNGIQASPALYATFFTSPSVMIEPQLAFTSLSGGGSTVTSIGLALQFGYLFNPATKGSGYIAANAAYESLSTGGGGPSANGPGLGASLGYRVKVKSRLAIRLDARYRRWFSDFANVNEFGIGMSLGAIL